MFKFINDKDRLRQLQITNNKLVSENKALKLELGIKEMTVDEEVVTPKIVDRLDALEDMELEKIMGGL